MRESEGVKGAWERDVREERCGREEEGHGREA